MKERNPDAIFGEDHAQFVKDSALYKEFLADAAEIFEAINDLKAEKAGAKTSL